MAIQATSHVAIGVRDMERSLGFYRDVLGMHISLDAEEKFPSLGDSGPVTRRGVYLRWREGPHETFIVLDQQLSRQPWGEPAELFQVGLHHFGFWVDSVDEILARAKDAGFDAVFGPSDGDTAAYGEPAGGKVRSAFLRDPDGNVVQLDQRVS